MNPSIPQIQMNKISNINARFKKQFDTNPKLVSITKQNKYFQNIIDLNNKNNSSSTSDSYYIIQRILSQRSAEEKGVYSPNIILENSENKTYRKQKFTTDIKEHEKLKINNSLLKEKLELFYKDKLNVSIISKKSELTEGINEAMSITQKIEEQINNLTKREKDPEKEEMKMLYRTNCLNEQIIYEKFFGEFFGFIATTFKNRKKENNNKLQIQINLKEEKTEKKIHYFAIYSGHKGINISTYLKKNLGQTILNDKQSLIANPIKAIKNSFASIDRKIINDCFEKQQNSIPYDKGGSCAHILIHFDNKIYIGNCGNSRSIISSKLGKDIFQLSIDHIPNEENEKKRIEEHGGKIIQKNNNYFISPSNFPFSRSIGDYELKNNVKTKGIIISEPDVIEIETNSDMDFILIGGFEIFLHMKNEEICKCIFTAFYKGIKNNLDYPNILSYVGTTIIETAIDYGAKDNLSIVLLIMKNLYNIYNCKDIKTLENIINKLCVNTEDCTKLYTPNKYYGYNIFELNRINTIVSEEKKVSDTEVIQVVEKSEKKKKSIFSCLCFDKD